MVGLLRGVTRQRGDIVPPCPHWSPLISGTASRTRSALPYVKNRQTATNRFTPHIRAGFFLCHQSRQTDTVFQCAPPVACYLFLCHNSTFWRRCRTSFRFVTHPENHYLVICLHVSACPSQEIFTTFWTRGKLGFRQRANSAKLSSFQEKRRAHRW